VSWSNKVSDYLVELKRLGGDEMLRAYPHPVLLHRFGPPSGVQPVERFRTDQLTRPTRMTVVEGGPGDEEVAVHAVTKRPGNPFDDTVMLGRAPTNDIVVTYADLSKLHAYFSRGPGGGWLLADAGSTNGTWVGADQLAANAPVALGEHSGLAFGQNTFEFFTAAAFAAWLATLEAAL
jgi:FHA domain-containing protein